MVTIKLPTHCDKAAADALLPEIVAAMGGGTLQIDGSRVTRLGLAMLQILVSVRRTGAGAHLIPSPALIEAARLTGLDGVLFGEDAA